jgi:hypothetical protein
MALAEQEPRALLCPATDWVLSILGGTRVADIGQMADMGLRDLETTGCDPCSRLLGVREAP